MNMGIISGKGRNRQREYASNIPDASNYDDGFPLQGNSVSSLLFLLEIQVFCVWNFLSQ